MTEEEKLAAIISILENSDSVWPKYGSDTIEEIAERILKRISSIIGY